MTIEQLFQAYDDGDITKNELFVHVLATFTPADMELTQRLLEREPGVVPEFEEWLDDISRGAEVILGSETITLPEASRRTIEIWREKTNVERYARLAGRMAGQWRTAPLRGEPTVEPEDVKPFVSRDVDRLVQEAA